MLQEINENDTIKSKIGSRSKYLFIFIQGYPEDLINYDIIKADGKFQLVNKAVNYNDYVERLYER